MLQVLIDRRKALPNSESARRCEISKQMETIRRKKDEERVAKIDQILPLFSSIKAVQAIKNRKKMDLTVGMLE